MVQRQEVAQQPGARRARSLGMKLHAEEVACRTTAANSLPYWTAASVQSLTGAAKLCTK